ncbi:hypothetical protein llap_22529 [Limosa lapponica baueri]|uniref:Uncharacterized protein n=1 Tax=Limosa lapponica baueri TaxID=1758121 RepID=A0A2I0T056_LIMLA|nr:hypothetical protein llap_22529 [Limosa lapponica baueri]
MDSCLGGQQSPGELPGQTPHNPRTIPFPTPKKRNGHGKKAACLTRDLLAQSKHRKRKGSKLEPQMANHRKYSDTSQVCRGGIRKAESGLDGWLVGREESRVAQQAPSVLVNGVKLNQQPR